MKSFGIPSNPVFAVDSDNNTVIIRTMDLDTEKEYFLEVVCQDLDDETCNVWFDINNDVFIALSIDHANKLADKIKEWAKLNRTEMTPRT